MNKKERLDRIMPEEEVHRLSYNKMHALLGDIRSEKKCFDRSRDLDAFLQRSPKYAQFWMKYWDEFSKSKYHHGHLDDHEEKELAWGLWCIATHRSLFNYYAIPHARHPRILQKIAHQIESIHFDDVKFLLGNSKQIRPFYYVYASYFFEKTIFGQNDFFPLLVLDASSEKKRFHSDNHASIKEMWHPMLLDTTDEQKQKFLENFPLHVLVNIHNDAFWEAFYEISTHSPMMTIRYLHAHKAESIGEKAQFLLWNIEDVQNHTSLFSPKIKPIIDFYLKFHHFFPDSVIGSEVFNAYHNSNQPVHHDESIFM